MKPRTLLIVGNGLIAGLLCLAGVVFLRRVDGGGFLSGGMSGSLIATATVAAACAAGWTSRRGLNAWVGKPFSMSATIVIAAYSIFAMLVPFVTFVCSFFPFDEAALRTAPDPATFVALALIATLYVVGLSVCIGAAPATLLEYGLCKVLLKRMTRVEVTP